jgi:hypothetical protein
MLLFKSALILSLLSTSVFAAAPVAQRQVRQQVRIVKGIQSGELTTREAVKLERKEARVNASIAKDRADGAGFTAVERAKAQHKLNRVSGQIYREKHDAQSR